MPTSAHISSLCNYRFAFTSSTDAVTSLRLKENVFRERVRADTKFLNRIRFQLVLKICSIELTSFSEHPSFNVLTTLSIGAAEPHKSTMTIVTTPSQCLKTNSHLYLPSPTITIRSHHTRHLTLQMIRNNRLGWGGGHSKTLPTPTCTRYSNTTMPNTTFTVILIRPSHPLQQTIPSAGNP